MKSVYRIFRAGKWQDGLSGHGAPLLWCPICDDLLIEVRRFSGTLSHEYQKDCPLVNLTEERHVWQAIIELARKGRVGENEN